jgi:hypothetical protein
MKKISFFLVLLLLILASVNVLGCGGKKTTQQEHASVGQEEDNITSEYDCPGWDPANIPRYPGSIRKSMIKGGASLAYETSDSFEDVTEFYKKNCPQSSGWETVESDPEYLKLFYSEDAATDAPKNTCSIVMKYEEGITSIFIASYGKWAELKTDVPTFHLEPPEPTEDAVSYVDGLQDVPGEDPTNSRPSGANVKRVDYGGPNYSTYIAR